MIKREKLFIVHKSNTSQCNPTRLINTNETLGKQAMRTRWCEWNHFIHNTEKTFYMGIEIGIKIPG